MRKRDRSHGLTKYIIFSLIIHLVLILVFPFGTLKGVADGEGQGARDFGFVQYVELKPLPVTDPDSTEKTETEEKTEEPKQKEEDVQEEEPEPPESEPEEPEKPEEPAEPEEVAEPEEESESNVNIETESEDSQIEERSDEQQEVLTAEESEMEIETSEEVTPEEDRSQIQQTEPEVDNNVETEDNDNDEEPPPPPPSAGDLIGLSPTPVYPKNMVNEELAGAVELRVNVASNGEVENIEIINSSGYDAMDRNARLTVENGWDFRAYEKPYFIDVTVEYTIDEEGNSSVDVQTDSVTFQ